MEEFQADIAILGGGVAGCIAAIALAPFYRVALIDQLKEPIERVGECLPGAARRILRRLELLEGVKQAEHLPHTGTISYWGSEQSLVSDQFRNPDGFGWHLDRKPFEGYLRHVAAERGVRCYWGTEVGLTVFKDNHWHLATPGRVFRAAYVIDATGRRSSFTRKLGIKRTAGDQLISCWATLPDQELNRMGTIAAAPLGWWYTAPLPNRKRVVAFQTDPDLIDRETVRNGAAFEELARSAPHIGEILRKYTGNLTFQGAVAANSSRLEQCCGPGWASVGDAAMSFDPLSSQGMFNAMAGAMQLTELLTEYGLSSDTVQETYHRQTEQVWTYYLKHKSVFYSQEKRWPEQLFWKRRIA